MARSYEHWHEFYEDVTTMCRNAMVYNEDGSEVYQDAQQIQVSTRPRVRETPSRCPSPPDMQHILESYRPSIQEKIARPNEKIKVKPTLVTPARPADTNAYGHRTPLYAQSPSPAMYASQSPQPPTLAAAAAGIPPNMYPPPHSAGPSPAQPGHFLPALPKGVVTEEIVASLDRYPAYEQSAWANSLSAMSVQIYRQLLAANDAKKRGISLPSTSMLSDLPSAGRPNGVSTLPDRMAPPLPTVKYLDFAFSTQGQADRSKAIRLHNMRGVVTHAVVLGSDTSELELTAYIADAKPATTADSTGATPNVDSMDIVTEVSLRVNGNPGSLPKFVHNPPEATRPAGMRWTINVPLGRNETKIEVVATKPGALAETSAIYISRQS